MTEQEFIRPIEGYWAVAARSEESFYTWGQVWDVLNGITNAMIWWRSEDYKRYKDDLKLLKDVAMYRKMHS